MLSFFILTVSAVATEKAQGKLPTLGVHLHHDRQDSPGGGRFATPRAAAGGAAACAGGEPCPLASLLDVGSGVSRGDAVLPTYTPRHVQNAPREAEGGEKRAPEEADGGEEPTPEDADAEDADEQDAEPKGRKDAPREAEPREDPTPQENDSKRPRSHEREPLPTYIPHGGGN